MLHTYPADYKVIFVGDASMSPYEITIAGGSVEHMNEESGVQWMSRLTQIYESVVWLNPVEQKFWDMTPSIAMLRQLVEGRMFPLTLKGLGRRDEGADALKFAPTALTKTSFPAPEIPVPRQSSHAPAPRCGAENARSGR